MILYQEYLPQESIWLTPSFATPDDADVLDIPVLLHPSKDEDLDVMQKIIDAVNVKKPGSASSKNFPDMPHGWSGARADVSLTKQGHVRGLLTSSSKTPGARRPTPRRTAESSTFSAPTCKDAGDRMMRRSEGEEHRQIYAMQRCDGATSLQRHNSRMPERKAASDVLPVHLDRVLGLSETMLSEGCHLSIYTSQHVVSP